MEVERLEVRQSLVSALVEVDIRSARTERTGGRQHRSNVGVALARVVERREVDLPRRHQPRSDTRAIHLAFTYTLPRPLDVDSGAYCALLRLDWMLVGSLLDVHHR